MPGWEVGVSRDLSDYIQPNNVTTILSPNNLCSSNLDLLIMVLSSTNHFDARMTIRKTWANGINLESSNQTNVRVAFILGQSKNDTTNVS